MDLSLPPDLPEKPKKQKFELKKLSTKHKQIASLLAQGVDRGTIAQLCECTPEYVTMLAKQPLMVAYMHEMNEFVGARLEAMFQKSVDTIAEVMEHGNNDERLRAARLQMEATKKLGKQDVKVTHEHSLVAILSSLPAERRRVPNWDNPNDEKVVSEQ